jgi:hypothetical protein
MLPAPCRLQLGTKNSHSTARRSVLYLVGGGQPQAVRTLSFLQARRLIRKGCEPFLVTVKGTDNPEPEEVVDPKVKHLMEEFKTVFDDLPPGLPPDRGAPFTVETGDSNPVFSRGYRHTPKEREQVEDQIKEYLERVDPAKLIPIRRRSSICPEEGW